MKPEARHSWHKIVSHIHGLVLSSSLWQLQKRGLLGQRSFKIGEINGNPGYLHALFRALDSLGWVERAGSLGTPEMTVEWNDRGAQIIREAACLEVVPTLLEQALDLAEGTEVKMPLIEHNGPFSEWLLGHQVGPIMLGALLRPQNPLQDQAQELLAKLNWHNSQGWTEEGYFASLQAGIYHYPISYLATVMRVEELLFGDATSLRQRTDDGEESHVDRRRDILFSGQVFSGSVAPILWDHFLPLFEADAPPQTVIDIGCGDGKMLLELGLRAPEARLIGVEYNPVARDVAEENLKGSPGALALHGDMGDPASIAAELARHGIDLDSVLWVTKSVIHNRPYRAPRTSGRQGKTTTVCVDPQGHMIPAGDLEQNLCEFFQSWTPFVRRHGFLVVEAHTVPPQTARQHHNRTLAPVLDYTHALSNQLLIEASLFRSCAYEAGWRSKSQSELGSEAFGHDHMTVDHFVA